TSSRVPGVRQLWASNDEHLQLSSCVFVLHPPSTPSHTLSLTCTPLTSVLRHTMDESLLWFSLATFFLWWVSPKHHFRMAMSVLLT
ncbi:hypothetical protein NY486_18510, partial [Enterobacter hormaechei]|nr:hypothetical protein [Enterobacter hormaechei]